MLCCVSTFKQLIWRSRRRVPKFMILCENDNFKAWCYCWWILDYIKCLQEPKMNVDCSGSSAFSGSTSWPCLMSPGLSTSIQTSWRDSSSTWPPSASSWPPSSSKSSPLHQATWKNLHQTNPCAVKTTNSNKVIKVVFSVYGFQSPLQYSTTWDKMRYLQEEPVQCLLVYYVNDLVKNFKEMTSIWSNNQSKQVRSV